MAIKIVLLVCIAAIIGRVIGRARAREVGRGEVVFWLILWLGAAAVVVWPQATDPIAHALGVGRGADLLVYLAVVALFFLVFRIMATLHRLDRQITTVVRAHALDTAQEPVATKK